MKTCTKCKIEKEPKDFSKGKKYKDGLNHLCRHCEALRKKQYKIDNPEAAVAYRKNYRLKRKFGLDDEAYNTMLSKQGGVCAICKQFPESRRLAVDHDHSCCSGEITCGKCIRGLLCYRCNVGLGYFRDNVELLHDAATYMMSFKDVLSQ